MIGRPGTFISVLLLVFFVFDFCLAANVRADDVFVYTHPSVSEAKLSTGQIRAIFSMKQNSWPNGQPIRVYVLDKDNSLHKSFCTSVLGLFPYQLERIWNRLVFSGVAEFPNVVSTEAEMVYKLTTEPGAIGYASKPLPNPPVASVTVTKQ